MRILIPLLLFIIVSCKDKSKVKNEVTKENNINNEVIEKSYSQNIKIIDTLYVTALNGLNVRDKPNGKVITKLPYGKRVEITNYSGIKQKIRDENEVIEGEWVRFQMGNYNQGYVFNSFLNEASKIKLNIDSLPIVQGHYSSNSKSDFYENGEQIFIDSLLSFEFISKNEFNILKKKQIDYINKDSLGVKKIKDTLFVNNHKYIDNNIDNDGFIKYNYIGRIDFLNKYILFRNLWENSDFVLIDKLSGEIENENAKLIKLASSTGMNRLGLPLISPNKKNMITLRGSIYTSKAQLNIFRINNNLELELKQSLLFKKWTPKKGEVFWISDNEFVVNAQPIIGNYETSEITPSNNYLKILIK